nr:AlNc14C52G4041 [Albugo laibachii Nc14]|eukprot:CCA18523.1 AlNc14C52G4041 [Albugo laibachii Nc14]
MSLKKWVVEMTSWHKAYSIGWVDGNHAEIIKRLKLKGCTFKLYSSLCISSCQECTMQATYPNNDAATRSNAKALQHYRIHAVPRDVLRQHIVLFCIAAQFLCKVISKSTQKLSFINLSTS